MYESFYRLSSNPFRLAPDSRFCFNHPCYDEARAYLEFAFRLGEGFVIFTGRPGTGKTTLVQSFLGSLDSTEAIAASIAVSNLNAADLLRAVAYAFDIDVEGMDMASVLRRLEKFFVQQVRSGKRILLIIDEAQGLSHSALEELRMLADLQIDSRFLLQVFLVGQERLRELMIVPEMEQFQQRVTGTCKLVPLSEQETRDYVEYRLCQVDWSGDPELTGAAVHTIYQFSEGIPRHINKLCTRLLLHGLLEGRHVLDDVDVLEVAEGLKDEQLAPLQADHTVLDTGVRVSQTAKQEQGDEEAYAVLALRAPKTAVEGSCKTAKRERRASVESQAKKIHGGESRTLSRRKEKVGVLQKTVDTKFYRQGVNMAFTVSGGFKRFIDPAAVLAVLAVVTTVLIAIMINDDDMDENSSQRVSRVDSYEIWEQLSRYHDGEYDKYVTYEEPDFVRENLARRSLRVAARAKATTQPVDDSEHEPTVVLPPDVTPVSKLKRIETEAVAEKSQPSVASETDLDGAISDVAAIEVFESRDVDAVVVSAQPELTRQATSVDESPSISMVAEPSSIDMTLDDSKRNDGSMMLALADTTDHPKTIADGKIDTVVPGAGSEQAATEKVRQDEIHRLLSLARESLREYRLLIPEGNNAYEYFRQVETLDPGNREAASGFQKIVGQYATLAEQAIRRGDDRSASNYIRRGLRVDPYDDDLLAIQVAMFQPEAGEADPAPVPPLQPPPKSTTLFSRLSELIDKDQLGIKKNSIWHDEDDELY